MDCFNPDLLQFLSNVNMGPYSTMRVAIMVNRAYREDEENEGDDPSSPCRH